MPRGSNVQKGQRIGGRQKGTRNKATDERLARAQIEKQAQAAVDALAQKRTKFGKDVLEEFMATFAGMSAYYQPVPEGMAIPPGRKPDETKFLKYAELTVMTAAKLADFQSPKFKAIQIVTPPANPLPPAKDGTVVRIDDPIALARVYQSMVKQVR